MECPRQRVTYFIQTLLLSILFVGAMNEENMKASSFPSSLYLPANLKNLSRAPVRESEASGGVPVVPVADVYYEYDDGLDTIPPTTLSPKRTDDIQHPFNTVVDIEAFQIFCGAIAMLVVTLSVLVTILIWSCCRGRKQCKNGPTILYEAANTAEDQSRDNLAQINDV